MTRTMDTRQSKPIIPTDPAGVPVKVILPAESWYRATWRALPPLGPLYPEELPFDLESCLERLRGIRDGYWKGNWPKARLELSMGKEEAWLWLYAKCDWSYCITADEIVARVRKLDFGKRRGEADIIERIEREGTCDYLWPPVLVIPLFKLLGLDGLIGFLTGYLQKNLPEKYPDLVQGFLDYILPYMDEKTKEGCRSLVGASLKKKFWRKEEVGALKVSYALAGALGMDKEIRPIVESLTPDTVNSLDNDLPGFMLFGLHDPGVMAYHYKRLSLGFYQPELMQAWLAHTEDTELEYAVKTAAIYFEKETIATLIRLVCKVDSPRAAGPMLTVLHGAKVPLLAKEWLSADPGRTIRGLVPIAGSGSAQAGAAAEFLAGLVVEGHGEAVKEAMAGLDDAGKERLRIALFDDPDISAVPLEEAELPAGLAEALKPPPKAKVGWVRAGELPAMLIGSRRLSPAQVTRLLLALSAGELTSPPPVVAELKDLCAQDNLERFIMKLFDIWLGVGGPPKDKWAFYSLAWFGSDRVALRLAPMVRAWPGESQHQRAVLGLEVLRAIGTDTALMQLNGIAQKVPFKALKQKAGECMEAIAKDLNLTKAELEDRIVPDCGLDDNGTRIFDYGERQWSFVLGPELKPALRDGDGRIRDDLPKPSGKDDPEKAEAALADWKLLKKTIRETARIQAQRLEAAMVTGRRWKRAEFEALIVRHPLLTHIARLALWAGYGDNGALAATFRVTEERDYADVADEAVDLRDCATIGVIHPLHIPEAEKKAWGELFADYAIVPPFPQLGRPVFCLEPKEASGDTIPRAVGLAFAAPSLVFTLEKLGYTRGLALDGGSFNEHSKQFPAAGVTAVVDYEGFVAMGYIDPAEELKVTGAWLAAGLREPGGYASGEPKMRLSTVDPVVISEVLYDLSVLAAKSK